MAVSARGAWGSRLGFILAAAGSAVGLGNIWGFPTQVGRGGGAIFVLVYLACVALICLPVMLAELALGRHAKKAPVGSFKAIRPGTPWWLAGALCILAGVGILSFYSVIAGWTLAYIFYTGTGAVAGNQQAIGAFFSGFTSNIALNLGLTGCVLGTTALVIAGGVAKGIERTTKALMPILLGLLVLLAIRSVTLPGAGDGIAYFLRPDLSRLTDATVYSAALGQAFFSLSLGMGTMITYGSYLAEREGIPAAAMWVVGLDTAIALLAGFIIFPAGFSIPGFDPSTGGAGMVFTVLPQLFATLPGGHLFGGAFFVLLFMAALTSTISTLEVPVSHMIDEQRWSRRKAVVVVTGVTMALAVPSVLATAGVAPFASLPGLGMDFLTLMSTVWNNFALPIGGLLTALFVAYAWKRGGALAELTAHGAWFPGQRLWVLLIRYVCPVAIGLIIMMTLRDLFVG